MDTEESNQAVTPVIAPANETFRILGNTTRLAILQALWEANAAPQLGGNVLTFSELRQAVGMTDSGGFNYHLSQLAEQFIQQTDEGYRLKQAGSRLIQTLLAGELTEDSFLGYSAIDIPCPHCEESLEVAYDDGIVSVRCGVHDHCGPPMPPRTVLLLEFPPAGLRGRTPEEVATAALRRFVALIASLVDGICPICASPTIQLVDICEDHDHGERPCKECGSTVEAWTHYRCTHCAFTRFAPSSYLCWWDPGFIAHVRDRGVPFELLSWESLKYVTSSREEVVERNPLRIRVTIPLERESVTVTLDESMSVMEVPS